MNILKKIRKFVGVILSEPSLLVFIATTLIALLFGVTGVISMQEGLGIAILMFAFVLFLVSGYSISKLFKK